MVVAQSGRGRYKRQLDGVGLFLCEGIGMVDVDAPVVVDSGNCAIEHGDLPHDSGTHFGIGVVGSTGDRTGRDFGPTLST